MKKTKEYYKDLLFLGYAQGERLTKEEVMQYKNSLASNQPTPENIVYVLIKDCIKWKMWMMKNSPGILPCCSSKTYAP